MSNYSDPTWRERMRIRFDFNAMMSNLLGTKYGLSHEELASLEEPIIEATHLIREGRTSGKLAWLDLPYQDDVTGQIMAYAASVQGTFENLVVLGIGGSALGTIALQTALNHPYYNLLPAEARPGPRLFVLDNVDPALITRLLDTVNPATTLFNVVSKSGGTAETMAQFLFFRDLLREAVGDDYATHIVATTDAVHGYLRPIADAEGFQSFVIPEGVGGRFSVLSPVGLLPAAICGIDIQELLAGAAYAGEFCTQPDLWYNPAAMNAALQTLAYRRGQNVLVMMPYAQSLRDVADWFRQLWAESLGKRMNRAGQEVHTGSTPVKALGTTDQHSQVQLYVEGPFDKVINFLLVDDYGRQAVIPQGYAGVEGVAYLGGHDFGALIRAEAEATSLALTEAGKPNCAHHLPAVNPFTVGQLLYMLEVQTAYAGELWNINAFDQPGVEAGKVATFALMARPGFEERRKEIENARQRKQPQYII